MLNHGSCHKKSKCECTILSKFSIWRCLVHHWPWHGSGAVCIQCNILLHVVWVEHVEWQCSVSVTKPVCVRPTAFLFYHRILWNFLSNYQQEKRKRKCLVYSTWLIGWMKKIGFVNAGRILIGFVHKWNGAVDRSLWSSSFGFCLFNFGFAFALQISTCSRV